MKLHLTLQMFAKNKKTHKRYFEVKILSFITLMSFHINKTVVSSKISSLDFIKNILICFLKMNKGLTGLEHFWVNYPFKSLLYSRMSAYNNPTKYIKCN